MPTKATIARTIILALALTNNVLSAFHLSPIPIDDETINTLVAVSFTVVAALITWWKNNSFTREAIKADEELYKAKHLKRGTDE